VTTVPDRAQARRGPPGGGAGAQLIDGEYPFTRAHFAQIAGLLHAEAGIVMAETKAPLVYARLVKRLRALGLQSFEAYCDLLDQDGADEMRRMTAALTTNVTRFFREPHHFEHLKTEVLPPLLDAARRGERVRIWSAGCSTGEEPYSIALSILALMPDAPRHDIRILASDIDTDVLMTAQTGEYSAQALAPLDPSAREAWFTRPQDAGGLWSAKPALRKLIAFRELNLIGQWPMKGPFHAVFCRNTVIYFDDDTQARIWLRMHPLITDPGVLYVGHSERVCDDRFDPVGLTTYALKGDR